MPKPNGSSRVVNPTNAPPRPGGPVAFTQHKQRISAQAKVREDTFNQGKDYEDEGIPLLSTEMPGVKAPQKSYGAVIPGVVDIPTREEIQSFTRMDESAQGQHIKYFKDAIVMDVDAKLITSTVGEMKLGRFREAHYPNLEQYIRSPHYRRLRESQITLQAIANAAKQPVSDSEEGRAVELTSPVGIRFNPLLVKKFKSLDQGIIRNLRESGVDRRLREQFPGSAGSDLFALDSPTTLSPSWDSQASDREFVPLLAGPYNKQLYYFDYLDMHCLRGKTCIPLLDGTRPPIRELAKRCKEDPTYTFWVYSFDHKTGRVVPGLGHSARITGRKAKVWRVSLDNGKYVDSTNEHLWMLRDGTYRKMGHLKTGDSLMPLYREYKPLFGGKLENQLPYEHVYHPGCGGWEPTHQAVYKSFHKIDNPYKGRRKVVIHHSNFDSRDNSPNNLELMASLKHKRLHAKHSSKLLKMLWQQPDFRERMLETRYLGGEATAEQRRGKPLSSWMSGESNEVRKKSLSKTLRRQHASGERDHIYKAISEGRIGIKVSKTGRKSLSDAQKKAWAEGKYSRTRSDGFKKIASATMSRTWDKQKEEIRKKLKLAWQMRKEKWGESGRPALNHKVVSVRYLGRFDVYDIEVEQHHNFAVGAGVFVHNSKAFEAWTHNPLAKRVCKTLPQFVLGKGLAATVISADIPTGKKVKQGNEIHDEVLDYREDCQRILNEHWSNNNMRIRAKQILRDLIIFGEQFIRYFDAPWGLKVRALDPSTIWEVVTDPDDAEHEWYIHQQYTTKYQWYVDLPIPTIKFIIRQVPSLQYFHMKINTVAGEVRGRSELFAILGWLKRIKEFATDRVIRNKMANLFVMDVAVEGGQAEVEVAKTQFSTPPPTGSFFIHNKAAELTSIQAQVGAGDVTPDWEMLMIITALGAGLSQEYLGLTQSGSKAGALVGTEPDIKTFEDYRELVEMFFQQDAQRCFTRAREQGKIPNQLKNIVVEISYPAIAEENRSEKLKDIAFTESMSYISHRRGASMSAKELQITTYDYDEEQKQIADETAKKEFLINAAYQQVEKGMTQSKQQGMGGETAAAKMPGGSPGPPPGGEKKESASMRISNEFLGEADRNSAYRGRDPRDVAESIQLRASGLRTRKRQMEATNTSYQQGPVLDRQRNIELTPDRVRDQKSLDRNDIITKGRKALKKGYNEAKREKGAR